MKRDKYRKIFCRIFSSIILMSIVVGVNWVESAASAKDTASYDCVAYVKARFQEYWGFGLHETGGGAAQGYYYNASSFGDAVSTVPKKGALAVWGDSSYGHVAFVEQVGENTVFISEGGYDGGYHEKWWNLSDMNNHYTGQIFLGFVYVNGCKFPDDMKSPANIGDNFCAVILNRDIWKTIRNTEGNVELRAEEYRSNGIWTFHRQGDGSYIIRSCFDGNVLDVANGGTANHTNVGTYVQFGEDNWAQKWYIYPAGDDNRWTFVPKCAPNMCMDVSGGSTEDGANIQIFTANNTGAQQFAVYKLEDHRAVLNGVSISADRTAANTDETIQLKAIFDPVDTIYNTIRWASEDESVATVDANGKVTAKKAGSVIIKCSNTFNPDFGARITLKFKNSVKVKKGDINGDRNINLVDLMMCLNHVSKKKMLEGNAFIAADIDGKNGVNLLDLMRILNYVSKKNTTL